MSSPNLPRRKTFLGVQAALDSSTPGKQRNSRSANAALVFSMPVMAGETVDPLNPGSPSPHAKYAIVPETGAR